MGVRVYVEVTPQVYLTAGVNSHDACTFFFSFYEAPPKWFGIYAGKNIRQHWPAKSQDAFLIRPDETVSLICASIESRPAVIQQ